MIGNATSTPPKSNQNEGSYLLNAAEQIVYRGLDALFLGQNLDAHDPLSGTPSVAA
jgi:hypothetical protein